MRYLLIGEAPARDEEKKGLHLSLVARAFEVHRDSPVVLSHPFARAAIHVNLLQRWPGRDGRGSRFPAAGGIKMAQRMAARMRGDGPRGGCVGGWEWHGFWRSQPDILILAGTRVRRAFQLPSKTPHFCMTASPLLPAFPAFVVPHPSGVSRWWNSPENRSIARTFLEILGHATTT